MDSVSEAPTMPAPPPRPAHVPPELVKEYPFAGRGDTMDILPRTLIPEVHKWPPVFWMDGGHHLAPGFWIPRRAAELQEIYMDTEHFTPNGTSGFSGMMGESWGLVPSESDPPMHSKYRLKLNGTLSPAAIGRLDEKIKGYARTKLEELRPKGRCEFVEDFAFEFPIRVFLELMGLPQDRMAEFLSWEHGLLRSKTVEPVAHAVREVTNYLTAERDDRRKNPKDDLLTLIVNTQIEGRDLTEDELKGYCFNLFVGGLDTVSTNMSAHFRHLAENPADQKLLREHPEKIPDAIEEMMRGYAAVSTLRRCTIDKTVGGADIKAGDYLLMSTFLAANDPEAFPNPEVIDFNRKPRHVSFGYGPHLCIGVHLARREMRIAMTEALAILPEFSIEPGAKISSFCSGIIGPVSLPLVWQV